jgi:adenine-specific DNA-methyltransferase
MTAESLALNWSQRFGLALAPLFEAGETPLPGEHVVLLDSGYGTFALSDSDEELWRTVDPAAWIWSSDVSHHVSVTRTKVGVIRWDRPQDPKVYERGSVERGLERFYTYLLDDRLRSNKSVVDHLLGLFRRLRSLGHGAGLPDAHATDLFTATLATMIAGDEAHTEPRSAAIHNRHPG